METVALLYEDYQKELAEDFKNTFLKRASDTDSSRSNDTVIDEVTDMLSTNIAVYTEKLLQRWGFSSGGEGGGGGDVTVTLDDLLKKYLSDNYVTIKGDQEVFGEKDFRKGIRIAGRRLYWDEGNDALVIEGAAYTTRWLSAKGVSPGGGGAGSGGAAAMYQLIDVSPNDTKDAVLGAEKDYVLTFDGSFWRGMPNKGGLSSKLFTALDKEGHEINPDDENAEIYAIRANYSLWSVGFLSAKGISDGGTGGGGGGAVALYQLLDVEKNADITGVAGATKGSVLTFNGDKWYADKPKTAAGISNLFTALDKDGNEVDLNDESKLGTITNIRANYALWSVDWISAKGKSSGGSGGGGGLINLVYGFESLGGTFDNNDNSATFNAFTINEIWKLASSGLTNVTVTGSGNAVTDVIKGSDGRSLTFTKGSTFATKSEFDALNTKFNDFLTGSDADDIINKWSELEVFLQGMKESDNLAVILQSKMDKTAFSKLFTALDASGNEVDPSDDTKTIASIRANFGFWGVDYISAKGVSKGSGGTGGASTLYQLVDVLANDTEDGVEGAAAGKALVFDGTHWRAGDAGLNESQLYSYLTANKYLTQSAADSRYVTSSRKVIAGTGLSGGGALTSDVTLSLGTSGVVAGTYTKVMVDAYGRVTSGTNLSATDIPNLDWSKITTGKPTTLAGYGITDAYTKTEADGKYVTIATAQTVSGAKTFSATMKTSSVLPSTDANSALGGTANRWSNVYSVNGVFSQNVTAKLLSASESLQIGDAYLKWDAANNAVYVIKKDGTTPVGFYSTDWLSAKGVSISGVQTGTLADLNDVEITDPVNGQALKYDAASKKWVNGTIDSFNVNQMWAELKKADSSKIIDASHIPTSVLDGRWVKKAGDTMTGTLTSASTNNAIIFKGLENCDITNFYTMNGTLDSNSRLAIRNGLRFNWYDTYWYIGNLRGESTDSNGFGIANESHKLCLQVTPNNTIAPVFRSTVATGVSPLIVSSNTLVNNLNSNYLEGYNNLGFIHSNYSASTGGTAYVSGDTHTMLVAEININTTYSTYVILISNEFWGHQHYSALQLHIACTNNDNIGNKSPRCSVHVMSLVGSHARGVRYKIENNKAYIFIEVYGGNNYGRWASTILQNYDSITTKNANTTGNIKLKFAFNQANSGLTTASYDNYINAASLAASRTLWGQSFDGSANVSGDMTGVGSITMSGDLTMNNTKGFNIGWSTRVVKTSGVWIHGGTDTASSVDANLRFGSWQGIGWYPTVAITSGVRQGNNAMWLNVRTGELDVHSNITSHNGYLAANWDSARRLVLGGGSTYAWIDSRNSSNNVLCKIVLQDNKVVIGNYAESSRFVSTVGTGTAPYQCSSTTLNTNLNADLLDGQHGAYYQKRVHDTFVSQHNQYDYIEFLRFVIPSGQNQLRAYVIFDLCRVETGSGMNGRAVLRIRRGGDNNANYIFYVTNFGQSWLPELRCTTDDGITWRVWMKCVKNSYDPYIAIKIMEQYPYGYVTTQNNGTTGTPGGSKYTVVAGTAGLSHAANVWTNARTFYIQDHNASHTGAGISVNGSSNVYLKLPSSIQCSDWFRSTGNSGWCHQNYGGGWYMQDSTYIRNYGSKRLRIQTDTYETLQLVRTSGSGGSSIAFYNGGGTFRGQLGVNASNWFSFDTGTATANQNVVEISPAGGIHSKAEITAKASGSDIRLKKDIQNYNAMNIINRFRSVKYHWNDIAKANSEVYNNDYDQFGLIAQDLIAGGFEQWVRDVFHDYYTVTYERLIPVVWKGLQEVDDEVTKLKREVARLNKRVKELEKSLCA